MVSERNFSSSMQARTFISEPELTRALISKPEPLNLQNQISYSVETLTWLLSQLRNNPIVWGPNFSFEHEA